MKSSKNKEKNGFEKNDLIKFTPMNMQAIFAVMSTTSRTGLNYFQALFFTTA